MSDKFFSDAEVATIRRHYKETVPPAQRLTDAELDTAILVAEKRQLYPPPLGQHIFFMKRKNREQAEDGSWRDAYVLSLQTGIDGFRLIAERTGKYVGSGVPEYEHDQSGFVKRAVVKVEKIAPDGSRASVGADAWFEEYAQYSFRKGGEKSLTKMWAEKGRLMLSKCAEALALRKAFPELSGLYTTDEMGAQDVPEGGPEGDAPPAPRPTNPNLRPVPQAAATPSAPAQERPAATPTPTSSSAPSAAPAPSATPPAAPSPAASGSALADVEKKKKLANAMALFCSTFNVSRSDMVRAVREWAPRPQGEPQAIGDAGNLNAMLTADEYARIVAGFKAWEAEKLAKQASPEETAEAEAQKWERENAGGASEDDVPF